MRRQLGSSGIEVSGLGMGCWAVGGPYHGSDEQYGWGTVDDDESTRAIYRALELGVTFFDTADSYGAGHSERLLGRALGAGSGRRGDVVIATKWGNTFDEAQRLATGQDGSPSYVRTAVEDSLRRLGTDYIDLYQLHIGNLAIDEALDLVGPLEDLVSQGKIRAYAWSTDDPERATAMATFDGGAHFAAVQYDQSVVRDAPEMVSVCEQFGLAGINRGPLAMGLLSGKYHGRTVAGNDVRSQPFVWMTYFQQGRASQEWLDRIDAVRDVLTSGGRTLAQGALAWLWARSPVSIPIPGFRTVAQVEENAGALAFGALTPEEFAQVERLLERA
jgi:aryl-alcohol dehydrogenase-like predicted oxidoreductase